MTDSPQLGLRFFNRDADKRVYVRVNDLLASIRAQADTLDENPEHQLQAQVMRNVCDALELDAKFAEIVTEPRPQVTVPAEDPAAAARGCLAGLGLLFLTLLLLGGCITLGRLVF